MPSPSGIPSGFAQRAAETLVDLHTNPTAPSPPSGNLMDFAGADNRKSHKSNIMLVKMYLVVIVEVKMCEKALETQIYSSLIYRNYCLLYLAV